MLNVDGCGIILLMIDSDFTPRDPNVATRLFGHGIASGLWTSEQAVGLLAETLTIVRCEPDTIQDDFIMLETCSDDSKMSPANPLFPSMVALTTRGIILRNNDNDVPSQPPEKIDLAELVNNTTEGIFWESESGRAYRERITTEIGGLLRNLVTGLNSGGVAKRDARNLVRGEIETGMDDVATRIPSYAALHFLIVSSSILEKADLMSLPTRYREVKRIAKGFLSR